MISKGRFRNLCRTYRHKVMIKRMAANVAWQWEADSLTCGRLRPGELEEIKAIFRKYLPADVVVTLEKRLDDGSLRKLAYNPEPFQYVSSVACGGYLQYQRGKHRQPPVDKDKVIMLNWDPVECRPMTEQEKADAWAFDRYVDTITSVPADEALAMSSHMRIPKPRREDWREIASYSKFAVAAAITSQFGKRG